jgi:hypothetical protein
MKLNHITRETKVVPVCAVDARILEPYCDQEGRVIISFITANRIRSFSLDRPSACDLSVTVSEALKLLK